MCGASCRTTWHHTGIHRPVSTFGLDLAKGTNSSIPKQKAHSKQSGSAVCSLPYNLAKDAISYLDSPVNDQCLYLDLETRESS